MVSSGIVKAHGFGSLRGAALGVLIAAPLAMGGCSADVSRFDSPFFGISDSGSSAPPRPAAGLGGSKPLAEQSPDTGGAYFPPQTSTRNAGSMKVTSLPDPVAPATVAPITKTRPAATAAPAAAPRQQASIAAGQTIDVQPGDTLYGLSRRHGV